MRLDVIPEGREVWVARGGMAGYYALVVLSVAGWHALRRSTIPRFVFLMPIVTAAFAAMTTFGATRYRAAAEPVLCLLGRPRERWPCSTWPGGCSQRRRSRSAMPHE